MLVGAPTNHTTEDFGGGPIWDVIPGSTDKKVGKSEPQGIKAIRCSLMAHTVVTGPQSCWGPLRNYEEHSSESTT